MKLNWIPLVGKATVSEQGIEFVAPATTKKKQDISDIKKAPAVALRSNQYFESGHISASVKISQENAKVQFKFRCGAEDHVYVGINIDSYAYGVGRIADNNVKLLNVSGYGTHLRINEWISVNINVRGSQIELFIDDVCVASAQASIIRSQLELTLKSYGSIEVKNINIKSRKPIAFVIMQFTDEYNALYKDVISPICESYGFEVIRADDIRSSGLIIEDVTSSIKESSLIIADITPDNPNVYYEVGYAHALDKTTILMSDRSREKLPFDISGYRTLFYDNTIAGKLIVEERLKRHLESICS